MIQDRIVFGPDIETTGLNPYECKIVTIQLRMNGKTHIWKEWESGEYAVISEFFNFWNTIPRKKASGGATFVSFNALHFDVPFILVRAEILGFRDYAKIWNILVHWPIYLDLYQLLGDQLMGYARWKGLLLGRMDKYAGEDIPRLYLEGEYDEIVKYVQDELGSLERIYEAIKQEQFFKELVKLRKKADKRG